MASICLENTDTKSTVLSSLICLGLVGSYLPQFIRIIRAKSSEGFSPWFLLLGTTSSTSGFLNIWILQWGVVRCCKVVLHPLHNLLPPPPPLLPHPPPPPSIESHLRDPSPQYPNGHNNNTYTGSGAVHEDEETPLLRSGNGNGNGNGVGYGAGEGENGNERKRVKLEWTGEWRLAVILAVVVAIHLTLLSLLAIVLLTYLPSPFPNPTSPSPPLHPLLSFHARFLGASSALLTFFQYAPQIIRTYRMKIVGALSIKMMCVQVPGSVVFVLSLVGREGVEWSAWLTYAFAGSMQAVLLVMCIIWRGRQRRLGQDDFGNPLPREGEIEEHPRA